jgi:hypothetical protein
MGRVTFYGDNNDNNMQQCNNETAGSERGSDERRVKKKVPREKEQ